MEQEKSLFDYARHQVLPDLIEMLQEYANNKPKEGAEVVLAIRHLQDARMRLGVAEAIADGKNPWRS